MPQPAEVVAVDDVEYSQKSMSCILISVVQDLPGTCRVMSNHLYNPDGCRGCSAKISFYTRAMRDFTVSLSSNAKHLSYISQAINTAAIPSNTFLLQRHACKRHTAQALNTYTDTVH